FNPAMPSDFKLLPQGETGGSGEQSASSGAPPLGEEKKRKSSRSAGTRKKKKPGIGWQQMKQKLKTRLGGLDKEKLKMALKACGIAAGVVLAIIAAVKMVPIAVLLLALLGLAGVIRIWDRLRRLPPEGF